MGAIANILAIAGLVATIPGPAVCAEKAGVLGTGRYFNQGVPGHMPVKFAPGIISTDLRELNSVFSPDWSEFYFAYSLGQGQYQIMVSALVNGNWGKPQVASFSIGYSTVDLALSKDNRTVYFGSNRPPSGSGPPTAGFSLWRAIRVHGEWSVPIYLGDDINSGDHQIYPSPTKDGSLYFQARRDDGFGGSDIYRSQLLEGDYQLPENLGPNINSSANEGDVLVDPDEQFMIVSVDGREDSLGRGDLYISFRSDDGHWSKLKSMGPKINSTEIDFCPMLTPDGKYLFFSSARDGDPDIFWVDAEIIENYRD